MITEWYAKGMDSGMENESGWGWTVKTQSGRADYYETFTLKLLSHPACVGWHWFKYMDNDPSSLTADPSNTNSNKGVMNNRYVPYTELLSRMKQLRKTE